jgi:hypothetical protein
MRCGPTLTILMCCWNGTECDRKPERSLWHIPVHQNAISMSEWLLQSLDCYVSNDGPHVPTYLE